VPRIVGISVVLLLAVVGVIAVLRPAKPPATAPRHVTLPSTRVEGVQTIGIVAAGLPDPAGSAAPSPDTLVAPAASVAFAPGQQTAPAWTADQMAGGTYIFINLANGQCLAPAARGGTTVLQKCDLGNAQRWHRENGNTQGFAQLRNAQDGRCLTITSTIPAAGPDDFTAGLQPCSAQPGSQQLMTFSPTF
jgi:Ricin-type beta-trefoil lectin domain-like